MPETVHVSRSPLSQWLRSIMIDLAPQIHTVESWSSVLGVAVDTIEAWLADRQLPEPRDIDTIAFLLEEQYAEIAGGQLAAYEAMADMPIQEIISPRAMLARECFMRHVRAQTLNQYRLMACFDNLWMSIGPLPPKAQREMIQSTIARCNELVLKGGRPA